MSGDGGPPSGIVAGAAHELASISYRQLDHWARQGWVTPSVDAGEGRSGRRRYSADDVAFMQGMIHHHAQAVEMANLVADRTNTPEVTAELSSAELDRLLTPPITKGRPAPG